MNQVVFNFHDVILLMTALLCSFFALLLLLTNRPAKLSHYLLAAFLFTHALIPLHELIIWGAEFKYRVRESYPELVFVGGFAYYLDAVLLYFYIKSLVYDGFQLRRSDVFHLMPLLVFTLFMLLAFYRHPNAVRVEWIQHNIFVYSDGYLSADFICKTLRVIYCAASLLLVLRYKDLLKTTHSNIEKVDILWLKILVMGFLVTTSLEALLSSTKFIGMTSAYDFQHDSLVVFEFIGLSGYYSSFLLVSTLVFTSMRYFTHLPGVKEPEAAVEASKTHKTSDEKPMPEKLLNPELVEKIERYMKEQKIYLQPDITLDLLAETLAIPVKDLSLIINRHFKLNFYEFINYFRIEEAKRYLASDTHKHKTITEIYFEVGFNSKSVFNTFFKKLVGKTPSEYRQAAQQ
jgi:AraC-like DNA-binding protein